jgi:hypothetical protein
MARVDVTGPWALGGRVMTGARQHRRARSHPAVATEGVDMVPKHIQAGAAASLLAAVALAGPAHAAQQDLRSPDTRDAATGHVQQRADNLTGGVRAPDWLSPDAEDAATAVTTSAPDPRTPRAPTVVEITAAQGFDWASAGIGAGGGIALVVIALAAAVAVTGRSRPAPH